MGNKNVKKGWHLLLLKPQSSNFKAMKLTINTLVAGFIILLMLPACSEQRFAFRKTIRVNDETISRINPSSETISILPASELGSKNPSVATGTQKAKSSITVRSVQTKNGTIQTDYITKSLEPKIIKEHIQQTKRLTEKEKIAPKKSLPNAKKLIVIGLILLLAGIVLGILSGFVGYLLSTIGGVILVIGIILLLLDYL